MTKANRVALPRTYHQPVSGGTGWRNRRPSTSDVPVRSSNTSQTRFSVPANFLFIRIPFPDNQYVPVCKINC